MCDRQGWTASAGTAASCTDQVHRAAPRPPREADAQQCGGARSGCGAPGDVSIGTDAAASDGLQQPGKGGPELNCTLAGRPSDDR